MHGAAVATLELRSAGAGSLFAAEALERFDRDHLALLRERALREPRSMPVRELQRRGGAPAQRRARLLQQRRLGDAVARGAAGGRSSLRARRVLARTLAPSEGFLRRRRARDLDRGR